MARVMIVDDAEFMRMVIKDTLLKHGHEVVAEAGNGEEAVQTYLEVKPDIVLMDLIMPGMDGKEALKELLTMDPEAKVVICSSIGQQALITESMKIGAVGFIVKPFKPDGMLDVVRKISDQISLFNSKSDLSDRNNRQEPKTQSYFYVVPY